MIYSPSRFVFIHIPRTGGFSVMQAVGQRIMDVGDVTIVASPLHNSRRSWWTHSRACELKPDIPHWDQLWKWAVIRNPWDMAASSYSWCVAHAARITPERVNAARGEADRLYLEFLRKSASLTFTAWCKWHLSYLGKSGGFWGYYCCGENGEDLGVEAVRFEELPQRWPELAERMGLPGQRLPHVNGAPANFEWTREAIDLVAELCRGDIERFGYNAPG